MVIQEVRNEEDNKGLIKEVQQSQQSQWTNWEEALQRSITWYDIWQMAPLKLSSFNTFYIWPAPVKESPCQMKERKRSKPVSCVMRNLKHWNMSSVPVRRLLLTKDTLEYTTVYWTSWSELYGTWWRLCQISQPRNLLLWRGGGIYIYRFKEIDLSSSYTRSKSSWIRWQ